ncbi:MAG TPA: ABC transporter substrate-binding protein [Dehalococcoidia bacterium]|nr:ABC transporter substrate-binding protein [Dehalococcoidia bacterium]
MKWLTKGAIILLIACLVLAAVSCGEEEEVKELRIGVIGPMQFQHGQHHWAGATLAADEINAAGGIQVGEDSYTVTLVQVDSNELVSVTDASSAAEEAITLDNVDVLMGTIRSEAALAVQEVAMDYETIFMVCGSSTVEMSNKVADDYDRYKYWFRITPVNDLYLGQLNFLLVGMVAQKIGAELMMPPKLAVMAEKAAWTESIVAAAQAYLPPQGIEVIGVWQPSDKATDVTAELTAIEDAGANMIMTALSGTVGIPYARAWEELEIPAASVGINVMAQADDFFENTGGFGNYETTLNTLARDVELTEMTLPFIDAFIEETGEMPTYNAGTYDAIYILKEAIERADSVDADDIVVELENTDYDGVAGHFVFDDNHDVTWGPGYITALGVQWQDGELVGIWPPADGSWNGVVYEGIVDYELPSWVVEYWTQ